MGPMIAPNSWTKPPSGILPFRSSSDPTPPHPASMGRRAHVRLDDPLAPPRARLRRAHRLFRSHDPRRSRKRPAQANSSRIGVFKRTLTEADLKRVGRLPGELALDDAALFAAQAVREAA